MRFPSPRSRKRTGSTAIEVLFVFATLVIAALAIFALGSRVIETYFNDGNQAIHSPLL